MDATIRRERQDLIQEIKALAVKPGELDDSETIRFKYAQHKLETVLKISAYTKTAILFKTEELFNEEIEQFHEVLQLGKEYYEITIELPKVISEDSVAHLKSAFADIKNRPWLVIRNSVPQSLVDSLTVFKSISITFTEEVAAEESLLNLNRSNSILDLPLLEFYFQFEHCDRHFKRIPILVAELFGNLRIDVIYPFLI